MSEGQHIPEAGAITERPGQGQGARSKLGIASGGLGARECSGEADEPHLQRSQVEDYMRGLQGPMGVLKEVELLDSGAYLLQDGRELTGIPVLLEVLLQAHGVLRVHDSHMVPAPEDAPHREHMPERQALSKVSDGVLIEERYLLALVEDHGAEGEELDPGAIEELRRPSLLIEAVKGAGHPSVAEEHVEAEVLGLEEHLFGGALGMTGGRQALGLD